MRAKTVLRWWKLDRWGIPLAYIAVTMTFGMVFPRVEHHLLPTFVMTVSTPAAMSICSSVASGMIALTGIVFSLTFVMIQFSATAYSPRLVLWVARDPVISHALGVFTSTFLYALFMLAWIDRETQGTVPLVSGCLVIGMLLVSMGMFIALIQRLEMLQVNRMLIFTGNQGRQAIEHLYQPGGSVPVGTESTSLDGRAVTQTVVHTGRPQVLQAIHVADLVAKASEADAVIEVLVAAGDTLLEATPLLRVLGGQHPPNEQALKKAFVVGDERSFEQDPKYALRLLVDIAIKALSPAINDPTTAVQALDQIEDLLIKLGRSQLSISECRDERGSLRVIVPFPSWDDFLLLALDEIRSFGGGSVQVMRRMNALVENLICVLPTERHGALADWKDRLQGTVDRSFADREEKESASVADRQGLGIGEEMTTDEDIQRTATGRIAE